MTYKWEAIAQDLTEERDRLLKDAEHSRRAEIAHIGKIAKLLQENERLRKVLETVIEEVSIEHGVGSIVQNARAALNQKE